MSSDVLDLDLTMSPTVRWTPESVGTFMGGELLPRHEVHVESVRAGNGAGKGSDPS